MLDAVPNKEKGRAPLSELVHGSFLIGMYLFCKYVFKNRDGKTMAEV